MRILRSKRAEDTEGIGPIIRWVVVAAAVIIMFLIARSLAQNVLGGG